MRGLLLSRSLAQRTSSRALRNLQCTSSAAAKSCFSTTGASSNKLEGLKDHLKVSEEVRDALATNKPVVALESTIYTHGAISDLGLEGIVRRNGAVPAVVGILGGVPTVGLSPDEVTQLVEGSAKKVSRRDIAYLVGMVGPPSNILTQYILMARRA